MKKIAVFASGSGSNAQNIFEFFAKKGTASVEIILTNNPHAYAIERAKNLHIPYLIFDKTDFYDSDKVLNLLYSYKIDLIVLAGFLWLIPGSILEHFPKRIVNIHPALLPGYGGKGMYGSRVHEAVIANKEKFSGITIHYVNERYDEGDIIFQQTCNVNPADTVDSLAMKVHALEYQYFPKVIDEILSRL